MNTTMTVTVSIILTLLVMGCSDKESTAAGAASGTPAVTTTAVSSLTTTSAVSGGTVTSDGGSVVTARGVCWATTDTPTTGNSKTSDSSGTGTYSSAVTGLTEHTTYYLRAYAVNSSGTGYGNTISFTTNSSTAGTGWTKMSATAYPSLYPSRIQFVDANNGFVGITPYQSANPVVARTMDGGATWTNLTSACPSGSNFTTYWVNAATGYLSAGKTIYRSTDAGTSWTQVGSIAYPDITAMYFTSVDTGYCVANTNFGISYRTTNGGVTWTVRDTLFGARTMRFVSTAKGFACADAWIGVTNDGAATWERINFPGKILRDLHAVNANVAYAVGDNILLLKTSDGGVTWTTVTHDIPKGSFGMDFNAVFFTSVTEGWITTTDGIYHTVNGGLHWTKELSLSGSHYGIWMLSNAKGFVCSYTSNGSMYRYTAP